MKKKIIAIIVLAIAASLGYFLFQQKKVFLYNGSVETLESDISARVGGIIEKYYVGEGSFVKDGDTIAVLDSPDIEIAYNLSLANYQRAQKLIDVKGISQEAFDAVKYKYQEALLKMDLTKIKAPIAGQIVYKYRNEGELVSIGSKIVSINNTEIVYVNIYVPYEVLAQIKIGDAVKGYLPELKNKEFIGNIVFINSEAEFTPRNVLTRDERQRLVYRVKAQFPNPDGILKKAMTLEIELAEIKN